MKKVLTLLTLLVTTLAAMATDFSDKCTLTWQDVYGNTVNPCEASVTDNGDGTSTIVLKSLTLHRYGRLSPRRPYLYGCDHVAVG